MSPVPHRRRGKDSTRPMHILYVTDLHVKENGRTALVGAIREEVLVEDLAVGGAQGDIAIFPV
jgi:hypothetical protein